MHISRHFTTTDSGPVSPICPVKKAERIVKAEHSGEAEESADKCKASSIAAMLLGQHMQS